MRLYVSYCVYVQHTNEFRRIVLVCCVATVVHSKCASMHACMHVYNTLLVDAPAGNNN